MAPKDKPLNTAQVIAQAAKNLRPQGKPKAAAPKRDDKAKAKLPAQTQNIVNQAKAAGGGGMW